MEIYFFFSTKILMFNVSYLYIVVNYCQESIPKHVVVHFKKKVRFFKTCYDVLDISSLLLFQHFPISITFYIHFHHDGDSFYDKMMKKKRKRTYS